MPTLNYESMGEGDDLQAPKTTLPIGTYHFAVVHINEEPKNKDGNPIDGVQFEFEVLAGTTPEAVGQKLFEIVGYPAPTHKDKGKFALQRLCCYTEALGLTTPADRGRQVSFDWQDAIGADFIATIKHEPGISGTGVYAKIDGCKIYRTDDPRVKDVPKNSEFLSTEPFPSQPTHNGQPAPANVFDEI